MDKRIFVIVWLMFVLTPGAYAEMVILKNGSAVEGVIAEKTGKKIIMDVKGVPMTYYLDEIEVIDGVAPKIQEDPVPAVVPSVVPAAAQAVVARPSISGLSKKDLILRFIDVFGTHTSLMQNFDQLTKSIPPKEAEVFQRSVKVEELIEALVPLYDKYFTEEELQTYVDFYSSPAGKKLVETIPHIMADSVGISLKYFKEKLPSAPAKPKK